MGVLLPSEAPHPEGQGPPLVPHGPYEAPASGRARAAPGSTRSFRKERSASDAAREVEGPSSGPPSGTRNPDSGVVDTEGRGGEAGRR